MFRPNRLQNITGHVIISYFLPILFLTGASMGLVPPQKSWLLMSSGLLMGSLGCLILFLGLKSNEKEISSIHTPEDVASESHLNSLEETISQLELKCTNLNDEIKSKNEELKQLQQKQEELNQEHIRIKEDYEVFKQHSDEQLEQNQVFLDEYQKTVGEQRGVIEKKQQLIETLENEVKDLKYEIKTLLKVGQEAYQDFDDPDSNVKNSNSQYSYQLDYNQKMAHFSKYPDIQVKTVEEASQYLKKCLDIAQKMTISCHFNTRTSKYLDWGVNHEALDSRRLFDNLGTENNASILLYSKKMNKLVFANQQINSLLGWSTDKVIQNFPGVVQEGLERWQDVISNTSIHQESHIQLVMKTKSGKNLPVHGQIGIVPTGPFKNYVIAVLYPNHV